MIEPIGSVAYKLGLVGANKYDIFSTIAPKNVPIESAKSACFTLGTLPSLSNIPALEETPTSVPTVSNISTKRKVKRTINISKEKIFANSNFQKIGVKEGGKSTRFPPGKFVTPKGIPIIGAVQGARFKRKTYENYFNANFTKEELENNWEINIMDSWLGRFLK